MMTLFYRRLCPCLLLAGLSLGCSAQGYPFSQEFKYGDKQKTAVLKYAADYAINGEDQGMLIDNLTPLALNLSGARTAKLRLKFTNKDLNICNHCRLIIRTDCHSAGTAQIKPAAVQSITLEESNKAITGRLDFDLVKNGSGQLTIGFEVREKGETQFLCDQQFVISYTVKGLPEPDREACEAA